MSKYDTGQKHAHDKSPKSITSTIIIVGLSLLLISSVFGLIYEHSQIQQLKSRQTKTPPVTSQTNTSQVKSVAQKSAAKQTLENCINSVNKQANDQIQSGTAKAQAAGVDYTPFVNNVLQWQQTATEQCQATYSATINSL